MNAITENILREAADAFAFDRTTGEISRYGEGHINDTFVVWASDKCKRYIMQRINTDTFKNPKELMENVCHVTGFLRKVILEKGGDPERETLNVIPTKEGKPFYTDSDGGTWRAYIFVEDTVCLQKVDLRRFPGPFDPVFSPDSAFPAPDWGAPPAGLWPGRISPLRPLPASPCGGKEPVPGCWCSAP